MTAFADDAAAVVAEVRTLTDRARAIGELRARDGRPLGAESRARLAELAAALTALESELEELASDDSRAEAIVDELERLREARGGVG